MSELTWYSRLLVWVGAIFLIAESAAGRTLGFATVIGVLALAGGLIAFVAGLALDARPLRLPLVEDEVHWAEDAEPLEAPVPLDPEMSVSSVPGESGAEPESVEPVAAPAAPVSPTVESRRGALGVELGPGSALVGTVCVSCHEPLRAGQVAAECRECGTVQHASCWVGNHFRCGRDGCGGQGPLEAPATQENLAGPSTA